MAKFFDRLEPEHVDFIERQQLFFVATAAEGAHPNLSPKGYDTLQVLAPDRLVYVDWPGSGNQTATHVAENGRITLMFCSFDRTPLILRVYGTGKVIRRKTPDFEALSARLGERVGPSTRQLIDVRVKRVQTSCGYAVPLFDHRGQRDTLARHYENRRSRPDWEEHLEARSQPQAPASR